MKGLVYVAALAPDEGETVADAFYRNESHPKAPKLAPDADGFIWMPDESFAEAFAQNATAEQIPGGGRRQDDPSETQHFMAQRMKATIRSYAVDHTL